MTEDGAASPKRRRSAPVRQANHQPDARERNWSPAYFSTGITSTPTERMWSPEATITPSTGATSA